jgi:hypothetical protein
MASVPISAFQTAAPEHVATAEFAHLRRHTTEAIVRRRPTHAQGRSLELLGHAIEYLVDSDLKEANATSCAPVSEAAHILMRLSREVFAECQEIVPFWDRVRQRADRFFERKHSHVRVAPATAPRT